MHQYYQSIVSPTSTDSWKPDPKVTENNNIFQEMVCLDDTYPLEEDEDEEFEQFTYDGTTTLPAAEEETTPTVGDDDEDDEGEIDALDYKDQYYYTAAKDEEGWGGVLSENEEEEE